MLAALRLALVAALVMAACGEDDPPLGPGPDASTTDADAPVDAGAPDLGPPDAGEAPPCDPVGTPLGPGFAPPPRDDMAYAADADCGRLFMFFGDGSVPTACNVPRTAHLTDGFVYDARRGAWFQLNPENQGPVARDRAAAIWDSARARFVMTGGRSGPSLARTYHDDVWAYAPDTNRWERLDLGAEPRPTGRMDFLMVADPEGDRFIVSHGGQLRPNLSFAVFDDTWAFDLDQGTWSRLATTGESPPGRVYPSGALDPRRRQMWLFGGSGENAFVEPPTRTMAVLDLVTGAWTRLPPDASWPKARFNAAMIHDPERDRMLLFGGHDDTDLGNDNDLHAFDLDRRRWSLLRSGDQLNADPIDQCNFPGNFTLADLESPERRAAHLLAAISPDAAVLFGGNTDCGVANDTWSLDLGSDTWSQLTASPVGMTCPRTGNPNCDDPSARMCD